MACHHPRTRRHCQSHGGSMNDYTAAIQEAYSFRRPAFIVGQGLMEGMIAGGLTESEDHPILLVLAGVLFAVAFILAAFL